jgi:hypothetical protein
MQLFWSKGRRFDLKHFIFQYAYIIGVIFLVGIVLTLVIEYNIYDSKIEYDILNINENDKFVIRVNTWRRNDTLYEVINHYSTCSHVEAIHIIWPDPVFHPMELSFFKLNNAKVPVLFEIQSDSSLNSRFNIILPSKSDAIFTTDDDIIISCKDLISAYNIWKNNNTDTMVGFAARVHTREQIKTSNNTIVYTNRYIYTMYDHPARKFNYYSIVLTKASFIHKKYLNLYSNSPDISSLRKFVAVNRNCEDILMAFVVSNNTNSLPWLVRTQLTKVGKHDGISDGTKHNNIRDNCINLFMETFRKNPLQYNHYYYTKGYIDNKFYKTTLQF